jgi:hypothetical protein
MTRVSTPLSDEAPRVSGENRSPGSGGYSRRTANSFIESDDLVGLRERPNGTDMAIDSIKTSDLVKSRCSAKVGYFVRLPRSFMPAHERSRIAQVTR